jgi:hypothetical protein
LPGFFVLGLLLLVTLALDAHLEAKINGRQRWAKTKGKEGSATFCRSIIAPPETLV